MRRCLELAAQAEGFTAPNPMVGSILVYRGKVLSEGWHHACGLPHAEADCLEQLREEHRPMLAGSTLYVNLEPCAHQGRTPPCSGLIIRSGIRNVVVANRDPFPQVDGKGITLLQKAGVKVKLGVLAEEASWLNRRFFHFHREKRPWVILKWAQSANGLFAPADRSRFQLSNAYSQQLVHRWRTEEAAILVGHTTALNDDPQLTSRLYPGKQPLRIYIDRKLSLPAAAQCYSGAAPTWILNSVRSGKKLGADLIKIDFEKPLIPQLMQRLFAANKLSLIVEGGAALLNSFIEAGAWDEARVFHAPTVIPSGIAAPVLQACRLQSTAEIDSDRLNVFVRAAVAE